MSDAQLSHLGVVACCRCIISVFALEQLTEHADCVFPLDNTALARLAPQDSEEQKREEKTRGFDSMNDVAAQMLSGLTW